MKHFKPEYYGYSRYYKNGYANITKCEKCSALSLYEDASTGNPCKHCGGKIVEAGSAKWRPAVIKKRFLRKNLIVKEGEWIRSKL
jgi:DNA-directed RNA polymerase subunit RPC12/RpoP